MRVFLATLRCRLGRHAWRRVYLHDAGIAAAVDRCERCRKVDVDAIEFSAFNRQMKRRLSRR